VFSICAAAGSVNAPHKINNPGSAKLLNTPIKCLF
jgi:hypothetical protein